MEAKLRSKSLSRGWNVMCLQSTFTHQQENVVNPRKKNSILRVVQLMCYLFTRKPAENTHTRTHARTHTHTHEIRTLNESKLFLLVLEKLDLISVHFRNRRTIKPCPGWHSFRLRTWTHKKKNNWVGDSLLGYLNRFLSPLNLNILNHTWLASLVVLMEFLW